MVGVVMRGHPECHSEDCKVLLQGLDLASVIWVSEGQGLAFLFGDGSPAPRGLSLGPGFRLSCAKSEALLPHRVDTEERPPFPLTVQSSPPPPTPRAVPATEKGRWHHHNFYFLLNRSSRICSHRTN